MSAAWATSLRGPPAKEEYYPDGTETVPCTQSLLPQGDPPCWYLRGHRVQYDR